MFWNEDFELMKRKHERNMYPPRVKMTVSMTNPSCFSTLPVKVSGCEGDGKLDMELTLPLGKYNGNDCAASYIMCAYNIGRVSIVESLLFTIWII